MNREINDAQRAWLASEAETWRGMGLLSAEQALAILSLYGTEAEAADRRRSQALAVLLFLAALLSGLGVLLLIAYHWEAIPAAAKVILILAAVVASHSIGLGLRFKKGMATASEVVFFLGCLLYGAGIALIGQIFHINANDASTFWWWALGVLPFAMALDSLAVHLLYVGLLAGWAGYEVLGFGNLGAWLFGRWGNVPNGAYSLLVLAAPGIAWSYRRHDLQALSLYVPLLAWWVILQPFAWRLDENPVYFIGTVGGLLMLAADAHREGSLLAIPYRYYGAGLVGAVLVPMSFQSFHKMGWMAAPDAIAVFAIPAVIAALAGVLVWAAALLQWRLEGKGGGAGAGQEARPLWNVALDIVKRAWPPLGLIGLFLIMGFWRLLTGGESLFPTIAANLAMIALAFWLMRVGLREDRGQPFAAGVGYFLLWTMLRYFDLFGDFGGMLGAALMFFLCGAALFGVALFWRRRKEASLA